ncbi:MAG: peptide chain release factor N(5)-glutamine methyltransferase [Planctomycetota bacterium]
MLQAAEHYLEERGVDAPRLSVEWMLAEVLERDRLQVYLAHDRPLTEAERARLREMVARRARHEPLAYILGHWEFMGHELRITPDVLVPRPETEHLAELAAELAPRNGLVADLGTGSGCIAIAVALGRRDLRLIATDVSGKALALARQNARAHGVEDRIRFLAGSFAEPLRDLVREDDPDDPDEPHELIDCLVSNPPYVDPRRTDLYDLELAEHEPKMALFTDPGDAASCYRQILAGMKGLMGPGGVVLLETGVGVDEAALELLRQADWLTDAELRYDLAGLPRYLLARVL